MPPEHTIENRLSKQADGTQLDDMAIGSLTFYHELFHLQGFLYMGGQRSIPDAKVYRVKCERENGECRNVPKE